MRSTRICLGNQGRGVMSATPCPRGSVHASQDAPWKRGTFRHAERESEVEVSVELDSREPGPANGRRFKPSFRL